MDKMVFPQVSRITKTLVTKFTVERFFASVGTLVPLQVRCETETHATTLTLEGLFSCVNELMCP